jgi:curved DNA-binding protein CbpA
MTAIDPHRTLGLAPGATQAEIKRAYRRLAKAYHPDSAGDRTLPRFLAIQAAYEALVDDGRAGSPGRVGNEADPRQPGGAASPPSQADPGRARATREAYRTRTRRAAGSGPAGGSGSAGSGGTPGSPGTARSAGANPGGAPGSRPGGSGASAGDRVGSRDRRRPKATIGSTSYDGADREPFDPTWDGATWYGAGSGTYWTINPKEYADPRKHGPEYLARSTRRTTAERQTERASTPVARPEPQGGGAWFSEAEAEAEAAALGRAWPDHGFGGTLGRIRAALVRRKPILPGRRPRVR